MNNHYILSITCTFDFNNNRWSSLIIYFFYQNVMELLWHGLSWHMYLVGLIKSEK